MNILNKTFYFDKEAYNKLEKGGFNLYTSDKYFSWIKTSLTGADILEKLNGEKTVTNIIDEISLEYSMPNEIVKTDVVNFCLTCKHKGIISDEKSKKISETDKKLRSIYIDITNRCNLNCVYCNKKNINDSIIDLSEKDIDKILKKLFTLNENNEFTVNLTGGEPLLNKNLESILKIVNKYTSKINIWTNGILLNSENITYIKRYCSYLIISIDDISKQDNDLIRGNNSYAGAIKACDICTKENVPFIIATTPLKMNKNRLVNMLEFCKDQNAYGLLLNEPIKFDINGNDLSEYFFEDNEELFNKIKLLKKNVSILNSWKNNTLKNDYSFKNNIAFIFDSDRCANSIFSVVNKKSCGAGVNELAIDVNGSVYPCHALQVPEFKLGSIETYKNNLLNLNFSKLDECSKCGYNIFCLGGCRAEAYFTNKNIYGNSSYCHNNLKDYEEILWSPIKTNLVNKD